MVRLILSWSFILLTGLFGPLASAQIFETESFEAFVDDAMSASNIPGLSAIFFDENGIIYEKSFGIADPQNRAVTLDTPFQLGSISKSFTALLLVQLAAEKRLDLDDLVVKHLPDFQSRDPEASKQITIRHLLSHRSGFSTIDGNGRHNDSSTDSGALERATNELRIAKLKSIPGERYEYSNANYMAASALIEKISGTSFEIVMANRIFEPLGMSNSYVRAPRGDSVTESKGFLQWFGVSKAHSIEPGRTMMGAGGVTASARDLAVYLRAIASKDTRILPPEFADQFLSPTGKSGYENFEYGLGWMHSEFGDEKAIYHSGLNSGFAANAAFFPGSLGGGAVLTNQSGGLQADVAGAVLKKGLGVPTGPYKPSTGQHAAVWGLLASALAIGLGFFVSSFRFARYVKSADRVNVIRAVLPVLILFTAAYALAVIIPQMNGVPLRGMKMFVPDIWLCLGASSCLCVLWGVTRLITFLRART